MSRDLRRTMGVVAIGAILAATVLWTHGVPEAAAQATAAVRTAWDYQSSSVELGALGAKLNEWGNDGWEVISIVSTESQLDTQDNEKPRLMCQRVEVVAKRPRGR